MAQEEDTATGDAVNGWIIYREGAKNELSLEDWLQKYRPSREELRDLAWIAVAAADRPETLRTEDDVDKKDSGDGAEISDIAAKIAYDLTQKIEAIESDPSIPVRAKKTKGEKSKKDMREIEYEITKNRLKNAAIDANLVSGKWMFFPLTETVDALWTKLAKAIVEKDGALRGKCFTAKVSPFKPGDGEPTVQLQRTAGIVKALATPSERWSRTWALFQDPIKVDNLCCPVATKLMSLVEPVADIYTIADIDSKHPSKMRSTLYGKNDFMTKEEIDAVFEAKKAANPPKTVVKKAAKGTGFIDSASDDDDDEPKAKKSKK